MPLIRYVTPIVIVFSLTIFPLTAKATGGDRIQILKHKLEERDKVIMELLQRVETLERRVGIKHITPESDEPSADKVSGQAVGKDNIPGKARPGVITVDKDAAERALNRSLTREGALLLPKGVMEIEPSVTYARNEASTPLLYTSGGQIFAGMKDLTTNRYTTDIAVRLGLPWDSQLEIGLPYRLVKTESVNKVGSLATDSTSQSGKGFGDLRLGIAKTLFREGPWLPNLVGRIIWDTNSGNLSDNGLSLGGGFTEFRGSLTAIKTQDPMVFVGGVSYEQSLEKKQIQPGPVIAANFGTFIAMSPETSIRFLLVGAYQAESKLAGDKIIGSDRTPVSFVVGGSTLLARGKLLNISLGIGLTDDANDFMLTMSLPFRLDKPLF